MASVRARAFRRAEAMEDLEKAVRSLQKKAGVTASPIVERRSVDPELASIEQLEASSRFIKEVADNWPETKTPEPKAAAPAEEPKKTKAR